MALTNNDIIKKLRVALQLRDEDIVDILKLADYSITKSELGAFFRNVDHPKYMPLQDQILRYFLNGLITARRGPMEKKPKGKSSSNRSQPQKATDRNRPASEYPKPKGPKSTFKPKSKNQGDDNSEKKTFKPRLKGKIERRKK